MTQTRVRVYQSFTGKKGVRNQHKRVVPSQDKARAGEEAQHPPPRPPPHQTLSVKKEENPNHDEGEKRNGAD